MRNPEMSHVAEHKLSFIVASMQPTLGFGTGSVRWLPAVWAALQTCRFNGGWGKAPECSDGVSIPTQFIHVCELFGESTQQIIVFPKYWNASGGKLWDRKFNGESRQEVAGSTCNRSNVFLVIRNCEYGQVTS